MTKEELFKKNYPEYVTEKGECLSPYWDLFSAGIECATYELNKGCIQILTKEKAELEQKLAKETDQRIYNFNKSIEWKEKHRELEKENEIFKKVNEIIAQQRDDRDAYI